MPITIEQAAAQHYDFLDAILADLEKEIGENQAAKLVNEYRARMAAWINVDAVNVDPRVVVVALGFVSDKAISQIIHEIKVVTPQ